MSDSITYYSNMLTNLPAKLYSSAFPSPDESPSSQDLMILVSTIAVMWAAIFSVLHRYLHPYAMRQQWLKDAMGREYDRWVYWCILCGVCAWASLELYCVDFLWLFDVMLCCVSRVLRLLLNFMLTLTSPSLSTNHENNPNSIGSVYPCAKPFESNGHDNATLKSCSTIGPKCKVSTLFQEGFLICHYQ